MCIFFYFTTKVDSFVFDVNWVIGPDILVPD